MNQNPTNQTCEYVGSLVTYTSSKPSDITRINHLLFGRVVSITKNDMKQKYYYPGLFEEVSFCKISNGCYFVAGSINPHELINVLPAVVTFSSENFVTGRDYWKDKIEKNVHNW